MKPSGLNLLFHAVIVFTLGGLGIGVTEYIVTLERRNAQEHDRGDLIEHLSSARVAIEQELNVTLHVTRALIAFVATHPDLTQDTFHLLADELRVESRHIRNLGLAPGNVLRFIHPIVGNEAALGLHYEDVPSQWPGVRRAIDSGNMLLDGPIDLVQGGTALIARTPIYAMDPKTDRSERYYWGLSSIVIDHVSLIQTALNQCECDGFRFALRNPANPNAHTPGATFHGESSIFSSEHVSLDVVVPGAVWEIAARIPDRNVAGREYVQQRAIGFGLTALITLLVSLLISARTLNRRLAMRDALTELPNRRYAFRRLASLAGRHRRSGDQFGVVVMDVNSFKGINDRFGHVFGDEVLTRCADALRSGLWKGEEVARIGGDEFLLILPDARSVADIDAVLERIDALVAPSVPAPDGSALTIGVSAGGALFGGDVESVRQLLQIADSRMYDQKAVSQGGWRGGGLENPADE